MKDNSRLKDMSGLDNAKRQGKRLGRKSKIDVCLKKKVIKLKKKNCGINEIGRKCNIGKGTIYKIFEKGSIMKNKTYKKRLIENGSRNEIEFQSYLIR